MLIENSRTKVSAYKSQRCNPTPKGAKRLIWNKPEIVFKAVFDNMVVSGFNILFCWITQMKSIKVYSPSSHKRCTSKPIGRNFASHHLLTNRSSAVNGLKCINNGFDPFKQNQSFSLHKALIQGSPSSVLEGRVLQSLAPTLIKHT